MEPLTWALVEAARAASASDFLDAHRKLQAISRRVAQWYEGGFDLLLTPTLAEPPPLLGEFDSPAENPLHGLFRAAELVPFTPPFNVSGQPAISLPLRGTTTAFPSACSWWRPTGARTSCCVWRPSWRKPRRGPQRRPPVASDDSLSRRLTSSRA